MRELLRTTDPVLLSWLTALLADAGIAAVVFDTHISIPESGIGAIPRRIPRRPMVAAGAEAPS